MLYYFRSNSCQIDHWKHHKLWHESCLHGIEFNHRPCLTTTCSAFILTTTYIRVQHSSFFEKWAPSMSSKPDCALLTNSTYKQNGTLYLNLFHYTVHTFIRWSLEWSVFYLWNRNEYFVVKAKRNRNNNFVVNAILDTPYAGCTLPIGINRKKSEMSWIN